MDRKQFLKTLFGTMFAAPVVANEIINKKDVPQLQPKNYTERKSEIIQYSGWNLPIESSFIDITGQI